MNKRNKLENAVNKTMDVANDIVKYIFMNYTNYNHIDKINFKTSDVFNNDNNPNYDIVTGVLIDEQSSVTLCKYYDDSILSNARDIVIECFASEFKDYKCGLFITNY